MFKRLLLLLSLLILLLLIYNTSLSFSKQENFADQRLYPSTYQDGNKINHFENTMMSRGNQKKNTPLRKRMRRNDDNTTPNSLGSSNNNNLNIPPQCYVPEGEPSPCRSDQTCSLTVSGYRCSKSMDDGGAIDMDGNFCASAWSSDPSGDIENIKRVIPELKNKKQELDSQEEDLKQRIASLNTNDPNNEQELSDLNSQKTDLWKKQNELKTQGLSFSGGLWFNKDGKSEAIDPTVSSKFPSTDIKGRDAPYTDEDRCGWTTYSKPDASWTLDDGSDLERLSNQLEDYKNGIEKLDNFKKNNNITNDNLPKYVWVIGTKNFDGCAIPSCKCESNPYSTPLLSYIEMPYIRARTPKWGKYKMYGNYQDCIDDIKRLQPVSKQTGQGYIGALVENADAFMTGCDGKIGNNQQNQNRQPNLNQNQYGNNQQNPQQNPQRNQPLFNSILRS